MGRGYIIHHASGEKSREEKATPKGWGVYQTGWGGNKI